MIFAHGGRRQAAGSHTWPVVFGAITIADDANARVLVVIEMCPTGWVRGRCGVHRGILW